MKIMLYIAVLCYTFFTATHSLIDESQIYPSHNEVTRNSSAAQLYAYIKTKYEQIINGRACIFYPAKAPKKLVITFGYAMPDRYAMWTWFWRQDETWTDTAYLFLKDDDLCWYLGNNEKPAFDDYCAMINHFIEKCDVSKEHVFTAGGSMGGYAAILFATKLRLKGAIVDIPTVRKDIWQTYQPPKTTKIQSEDRWLDVDTVMKESDYIPFISIHHGRNKVDVLAAHALIDVLIYKAPLIVYRTTSKSAHSLFTITKASLEFDIAYMEDYDAYGKEEADRISAHFQSIHYDSNLFFFGFGLDCYELLRQALDSKSKGVLLINPVNNDTLLNIVQKQIEQATELPFISLAYTRSTCTIAHDLIKMMREKIGCFTLHIMPSSWEVTKAYVEKELHHMANQKLLQLPHFM
jgi:pimeloyl-ACP methyl ester carboxylesterase